jgi:hypothetical protein
MAFIEPSGVRVHLTPDDYAQTVLLDSGSSYTAINNEIFSQIINGFGAVGVGQDYQIVPCSYADVNGYFEYAFGDETGPVIRVPVSQAISPQWYTNTEFQDESGGCVLMFGPPSGGQIVLGDSFLRGAYAVFDLENRSIALAQAAVNKTDTSSIVTIPRGTAIPGASITVTLSGTSLAPVTVTTVPAARLDTESRYIANVPSWNLGVTRVTSYSMSTTLVSESTATLTATSTSSSSGPAKTLAPTPAAVALGLMAGLLL